MARLPRLYAANQPQLIQVPFCIRLDAAGTSQAVQLLDRMADWLNVGAQRQIELHGWVFAYEQIMLLATPADALVLPQLVQMLGRNLAAHLRQGRVFARRYRSTLVQAGVWLLPAQVWLETLPVRLGLTREAELWPWSSAASHTGSLGRIQMPLSDHPDYWQCGNTPFDRQAHYLTLLQQGLRQAQAAQIAQALWGSGR